MMNFAECATTELLHSPSSKESNFSALMAQDHWLDNAVISGRAVEFRFA
jgi:hypothetical protein